MLLYIGNQENQPYLQKVANELKEPVCTVPAPIEAYQLPQLAKPMYTHYVIDIQCYCDNLAALIAGLKNLASCTQGKIMLLAVDMTTQTSVVSELIYAGFNDILFCSSDRNGLSYNKQQENRGKISTELIQKEVFDYPIVSTEPLKRDMDLMRTEPMRELPWVARTPVGGIIGQEGTVSSVKVTEEKGHSKLFVKILLVCGCCLVLLIGITVLKTRIVGKQSGKAVANMELAQRNSQGLIPVIPDSSSGTPTVEPTKTPYMESTPTPANQASIAPVKPITSTEQPQTLQIPEPTKVPDNEPEPTQTPLPEKASKGVNVDEEKQYNSNKVKILKVSLPSGIRIMVGNSITITPKYEPAEATGVIWKWSSSNTEIVTVDNGKITAVSQGEAKITLETEDGLKASCKVSVAEE